MTAVRSNSFVWPAALLCLAAGSACAADFSVGVATGADQGRVDCVAGFACEHNGSFGKLFGVYSMAPAYELQATLFDAGRFKGGDTTPLGTAFGGTFKVSGLALSLGYRWALAPEWSLVARAGIANVRTRFDYANAAYGSASKTTTQPLIGLGVSYALAPTWRVGLDFDLTRFKVHTTQGRLQMLGLAAQVSF